MTLLPCAFAIEGQLGHQEDRGAGVLVADLRRHQDAVALLAADDEIVGAAFDLFVSAGLLELLQHLGDVLEADQQVVDDLGLEMPGDARHHDSRSPAS